MPALRLAMVFALLLSCAPACLAAESGANIPPLPRALPVESAPAPAVPAPDAGLASLSRSQIEVKAAHGFTPDGRFAVTFDAHSDPAYPGVIALERVWRREGATSSYARVSIAGSKILPHAVESVSYLPDGGLEFRAAEYFPDGKGTLMGSIPPEDLRGDGRAAKVLRRLAAAIKSLVKS